LFECGRLVRTSKRRLRPAPPGLEDTSRRQTSSGSPVCWRASFHKREPWGTLTVDPLGRRRLDLGAVPACGNRTGMQKPVPVALALRGCAREVQAQPADRSRAKKRTKRSNYDHVVARHAPVGGSTGALGGSSGKSQNGPSACPPPEKTCLGGEPLGRESEDGGASFSSCAYELAFPASLTHGRGDV
jgi:hypothetical protein